jgi:hypothetical protein
MFFCLAQNACDLLFPLAQLFEMKRRKTKQQRVTRVGERNLHQTPVRVRTVAPN